MTAIHFNVKCPYCGVNMRAVREGISPSPSREVVLCDAVDEPSCDRYFVAEFTVIPTCKTKGIDDDVTAIT